MAFDQTYSVADASERKSERFTCPASLDLVHKLRRNSDCVLVGKETVVRDDCTLTVRRVPLLEKRNLQQQQQQPVRVVIDSKLQLLRGSDQGGELSFALLKDGHRTIIYHSCENVHEILGKTKELLNNITLVKLSSSDNLVSGRRRRISPAHILQDLKSKNIHHVMIEGGPATAIEFLKEKLVDRAMLLRAPVKFVEPVPSGMSDLLFQEAGLVLMGVKDCGEDVVEYWVRKGGTWPTENLEDWPI
jgi:riboflavin-specific deaminase-like protein